MYNREVIDNLETIADRAYRCINTALKAVSIPNSTLSKDVYEELKINLTKSFGKGSSSIFALPVEEGIQRYVLQYIMGYESSIMLYGRAALGKPLPPRYSQPLQQQLSGAKTIPKRYDNKNTIKEIINSFNKKHDYALIKDMAQELTRVERYDLVRYALDYVRSSYKKIPVKKNVVADNLKFNDFKRVNKDFFKYFKK